MTVDRVGTIESTMKGLQGYGIMALELIQNADDAGAKQLSFDATKSGLFVTNDAEFTSCGLEEEICPGILNSGEKGVKRACNFHAIIQIASRSKMNTANQTGRFGIGFISVYQITDTPIIRSVGKEIKLHPLTGDVEQKAVEPLAGTEFEFPWASVQSEFRNEIHASITPENIVNTLAEEISEVLHSSLIFLRNLEFVEIRQNGEVKTSVQIERTDSGVYLIFGPVEREEEWLVLSRDAKDIIEGRSLFSKFEKLEELNRSPEVSIAVLMKGLSTEGMLYAYLPTQHKTKMPLHINADFFPHASRQEIVLKGESQEREWNEAMIATAAELIEEKFITIRDTLSPTRFWDLGKASFNLKNDDVFSEFWGSFSKAATAHPSVWTTGQTWSLPNGVYKTPDDMPEREQDALCSIGLKVLNLELRSYWSPLKEIGVAALDLVAVIDGLEEQAGTSVEKNNPHTRDMWSVVNRLLEGEKKQTAITQTIIIDKKVRFKRETLDRLKNAIFLVDVDGNATFPDNVWKIPESVSQSRVERFAPDCPLVDKEIVEFTKLAELIDEYEIDDFAKSLAKSVADNTPEQFIGRQDKDIKELYELLANFKIDPETSKVGEILKETPFLRKLDGFVTPNRALLPSRFTDPTGYFEFVDNSLFTKKIEQFVKIDLGVQTLNFHDYIEKHLESILDSDVTKPAYQSLLSQLADNKESDEEKQKIYKLLSERAFVKTCKGNFVLPEKCLYKTKHLEKILGNETVDWVDEEWMPSNEKVRRDLQIIMQTELGMPTKAQASHFVTRLTEISQEGTPDEVAKAEEPIIQELIKRWDELDVNDLEPLKELEFIPALKHGERDSVQLYAPQDVHHATRSKDFSNQVPVIDLPALTKNSHDVNTILDWLGVKAEPTTEHIVEHLKQCMANNEAPAKLTYKILNKRVKAEDDNDDNIRTIKEKLQGEDFIWNHENNKYMRAEQMFWSVPRFGNYWWWANDSMKKLEDFYRLLGVIDKPNIENYGALALEITAKDVIAEEDLPIHSKCLAELGKKLDAGDDDVTHVIRALCDKPSLININREVILPTDAVWIDSDKLVEPFGEDLNGFLVKMPDMGRGVATRLFSQLGVRPITKMASLQLVSTPDSRAALEDTQKLRDRSDLLLWLGSTPEFRLELGQILSKIKIQLTDALWTQGVCRISEPPIESLKTEADAFLDINNNVLYIKGDKVRWTTTFKTIFNELENRFPVEGSLSLAALSVMSSDSKKEAEEILYESGYSPPEEIMDIAEGRQFDDGQDDAEDGDDAVYSEATEQSDSDTIEQHHETENFKETENGIEPYEGNSVLNENTPYNTENTSSAPSTQEDGDQYKSKAISSKFGMADDSNTGADSPVNVASDNVGAGAKGDFSVSSGKSYSSASSGKHKGATPKRYTYVGDGNGALKSSNVTIPSKLIIDQIDEAAIKAVVEYEEDRGWTTEIQPHNNPGFDIKSFGPNGERRLIEVKGIDGHWNEGWGTKMSHVQFKMAQDNPDEFWLYVVERARDVSEQKLSAISNPFQQVKEYWFDYSWRDCSEETANLRDSSVREGGKVKHKDWGEGTILVVDKRGLDISVKVDFGPITGTRYIPFNDRLELLD